jgi:16S rRNA (guanine(966)-N(2))-methyltransferase RsmD
MIRVISGSAGGLKLHTLDSDNTKPTLDRVKEAAFSMLRDDIYGATVLDLFSGSGALGIEALSRGAKKCYFNDKSKACCDIIKKNLASTRLDGSAEVSCADFTEIIASFKKRGICFDLILIDPPYNSGFYTEALELISKSNAVSEYCTILCEHSAADVLPEQIGIFSLVKTRKYGTVNISIYRNEVD